MFSSLDELHGFDVVNWDLGSKRFKGWRGSADGLKYDGEKLVLCAAPPGQSGKYDKESKAVCRNPKG